MKAALAGGAWGMALLLWAFAAAGAGHGSYLPMALAAAPISSLSRFGFVLAPVWWCVIGYALGRRWAFAALVMLALHVGGAAMNLGYGTPWESARQQWDTLRAPWAFVLVWPAFAAYVAGVAVAVHTAVTHLVASDDAH